MKYLLNKYGGPLQEKLYPSEPRQQALVDQCLFFEAGVLFPRIKVVAVRQCRTICYPSYPTMPNGVGCYQVS